MPAVLRADLGMGAVPACLIFVFYFFVLDANRLTRLYGHESPNLLHAVISMKRLGCIKRSIHRASLPLCNKRYSVVLLSKNIQFLQPFFYPWYIYTFLDVVPLHVHLNAKYKQQNASQANILL